MYDPKGELEAYWQAGKDEAIAAAIAAATSKPRSPARACSCGSEALSMDYLCRRCREVADDTQHPMVGKSVVDVEIKDGMGGTVITFEDGSVFHSIYSRFTP